MSNNKLKVNSSKEEEDLEQVDRLNKVKDLGKCYLKADLVKCDRSCDAPNAPYYNEKYVECDGSDEIEVYVQGWFNKNRTERLDHDYFTLYKFPVFSTVGDLVKYIENERWNNSYKIPFIFQTVFYTENIFDNQADLPSKIYQWQPISEEQLLPFVSHWDCYWALDKYATGMLFRLNKNGLEFNNNLPIITKTAYFYSMMNFITHENNFSDITILIRTQKFKLTHTICSVRCKSYSGLIDR